MCIQEASSEVLVFGEVSSEDDVIMKRGRGKLGKFGKNKLDKFGNPQEKGDISFRTNDHSCDKLHRILTGDKDNNYDEAWRYNFRYDYFQTRFGAAVPQ